MSQPNWQRVQEIFEKALALPVSERDAFVKQAAAGDAEVEQKVLSLLAAHDSSHDILESSIFELPVLTTSGTDDAQSPSSDKLIGTKVGERYLIERKLGQGGMGQVYLAHDLRVNSRAVVLKFLCEELREDTVARDRFKKEAEALSRIHHAGVVAVLDQDHSPDGLPYIVLQYVEGKTLASLIPPEGMNLERAASILKQIGLALEQVHDKQIFHRDLKPENIMLEHGTDSVVLVDFGIAKVRDSLVAPSTETGASAGTLLYMSPEQLRDQPIEPASDVYSMALIAYEIVTGRRPFNASSVVQLLELQRKGAPAKPTALRPSLPREAEKVILRGMSFDLKRRYKRAGEFGHHLARALKSEEVGGGGRPIKRLAAVVTCILITSAAGLFALSKCNGTEPTSNRSFTYWLEIQRTRDGQDYKEPDKSHGEKMFERDDKFQLNVLSPASGYVYVVNEGSSQSGDTNFVMIYPRKATNNGSASLGAGQSIQSDWSTFRGPAGSENFWLVWSVSPVSQLESAKAEAFAHPRGGLSEASSVAVKDFLRRQESAVKVKVYHYNSNQNAVVRGPHDILVTLAQFKYR